MKPRQLYDSQNLKSVSDTEKTKVNQRSRTWATRLQYQGRTLWPMSKW